jgi:hypothetical protein
MVELSWGGEMGNEIKVYCTNCKYCKTYENAYGYYVRLCIRKTNKFEEKDTYYVKIKKRIIEKGKCSELNENNHCLNYRRKWCKFWIEPKRRYETKLEQVMHDIVD